jgi:methylated-DNA-[protein]-cysteine S-methyltransferase
MKLTLSTFSSPVGELLLVTDPQGQVRALDFSDHRRRLMNLLGQHYPWFEIKEASVLEPIAQALASYFSGCITALENIPIATNGSPMQEAVWEALRKIPAGTTTSYVELARALGHEDPRAAISVGEANNTNPVAIIVPCHRVIAKNGELKGYAGGVHRKKWLLEHEGALKPVAPEPVAMRLPGL